MLRFATALVFAASIVMPASAADSKKTLKVGDTAPTFSDLQTATGKTVSLADFKDKDVVVVAITCNHCPVAKAYQDRIINLTKKYATGSDAKVAVVAINVNNDEDNALPAMKTRAEEKHYNFIYAYDPSQKIARELGARVTPEFYVLNRDRKVVYMGAMDDSNNPEKANVNYVEQAIQAALEGKTPETTHVNARGCGVAYETK